MPEPAIAGRWLLVTLPIGVLAELAWASSTTSPS
jgi:hypothetical protein